MQERGPGPHDERVGAVIRHFPVAANVQRIPARAGIHLTRRRATSPGRVGAARVLGQMGTGSGAYLPLCQAGTAGQSHSGTLLPDLAAPAEFAFRRVLSGKRLTSGRWRRRSPAGNDTACSPASRIQERRGSSRRAARIHRQESRKRLSAVVVGAGGDAQRGAGKRFPAIVVGANAGDRSASRAPQFSAQEIPNRSPPTAL